MSETFDPSQNVDEPIEEPAKIDTKLEKAERMLASIKGGWSLTISRIRPGWCSGYLERIECTEDEPIDMDYIIEQWGGKMLRLRLCDERGTYRGGADMNLQAYPPKFRGTVMHNNEANPTQNKTSAPTIVQQPAAAAQPNLIELLGLMSKTRNQDINTLRTLLDQAQPQPQYAPQQGGFSGIDDMINFASKFKQLQELMGNFGGGGGEPAEDAGILGSIGEVLKMFNQTKQVAVPQPVPKTRRSAHVVSPHGPQPAQNRPIPPKPAQNVPQCSDLSSVLAELDADDYKNTFLTSLQQMPDDKRNQILADFMENGLPDDLEEEYEEYEETEEPEQGDSQTGQG